MRQTEKKHNAPNEGRSRGTRGKQLVGRVPNMYWVYLLVFIIIFALINSTFGGALGAVAWLVGVDATTMIILLLMISALITFLFINVLRR